MRILAIAGSVVAFSTLLWSEAILAGPPTDGVQTGRSGGARTIAGQERRYRVTDMCSITGNANPCSTVIQVNNLSASTCDVGAHFFKGFVATPVCTVTFLGLVKGLQATLCSRNAGDPESCNSTCDPALTFDTGFATVFSSCDLIGVQATILTKESTDTTVTSARDVNLIYIAPTALPLKNSNRGD